MRMLLAILALALTGAAAPATRRVEIPVELAIHSSAPMSGRLIIFAAPAKRGEKTPDSVDANPFAGTPTAVAARDVASISTGQVATVDTETDSVPGAWSRLPRGRYHVQAVLDVNGDYNYFGRGAGDLISNVTDVDLPGSVAPLRLSKALPQTDSFASLTPEQRADLAKVVPLSFVSPLLSAFWGRPIQMRGAIALPPGYDPAGTKTWPTVYLTHGFGAGYHGVQWLAAQHLRLMNEGQIPPMIWVSLDESFPTGTHEFADSVNNGPWGEALTTELIPWLERNYRMDARPSGRFLTGHSSGGWATLWLQTRYPAMFGGTWSTSPDPSDFHDFTGADIYRPNANVYFDANAKPVELVRINGRDVATLEQFAKLETVIGPVGGQLASFDWVFSPKGADGRPMPMFDRRTGAVDPAVAAYWRDHYDIAYRLEHNWPELKKDLDGKIHVIVGTADTFHLDGPAHRLQAVLQRLGAKADVRFLPGKTHGNLYEANGDPQALTKQIAREMYAIARPQSGRRSRAAPKL